MKQGTVIARLASLGAFIFVCLITSPSLSQDNSPTLTPALTAELLYALGELPGVNRVENLSPAHLLPSKSGVLYGAHFTGRRIDRITPSTGKSQPVLQLPSRPTGMAETDEGHLVITAEPARGGFGEVLVVDPMSKSIVTSFPSGHSPRSPIISPSRSSVYICNRFENKISEYELSSGKILRTVTLPREPYVSALTPDGKTLIVTNFLPTGRVDLDSVAAAVTFVDVKTFAVTSSVNLCNGSHSLQGLALSPDGNFAYISHNIARFQIPITKIIGGWINVNGISVIDIRKNEFITTVLLDDMDAGAANLWGISVTPDGKTLAVAGSGSEEVILLDLPGLHTRLSGSGSSNIYDFTRTSGLKRRVPVSVKSPRALAIQGAKVWVAGYFSDDFAFFDLEAIPDPKVVSFGSLPPVNAVRRGEYLTQTATICLQQWMSCTSCHPENRPDGINWDHSFDGFGNHKNVKSHLFAHLTPPVLISGLVPNAEEDVRASVTGLLYSTLPETDYVAIDEYLKSLRPVPGPALVHGKLSPLAEKGKEVYTSVANCKRCHPQGLYTNLKSYKVGDPDPIQPEIRWDVPTLLEVWRTGPYLHDGRFSTLDDLLKKGRHGLDTVNLDEGQMSALIEFVKSL